MKNFFVFSFALLAMACTKDFQQAEVESSDMLTEVNFNVTMDDVQKYVKARTSMVKSVDDFTITPISIDNDTLVYIINGDNFCELLVGDKRLEPFLMKGDRPYCLDSLNVNEKFWLESELDYIQNFKNRPVVKSFDGIDDFWLRLESPSVNTKVEGDPIEDNKYWELEEIQGYDYKEVTDGHLLKTNWSQKSPWNACVPLKSGSTTERCPAGCVAVACAQVLHFLNDSIGKPSAFFTSGYCDGNKDGYSFSFSDMSETSFSNMALNTWDYNKSTYQSALLIGWVGSKANLDYGNSSTGGDFSDCKKVLNSCGIDYTYTKNFDRDVVFSSLIRKMPVILGGQKKKFDAGLFSITYGGHAWVADGYVIGEYTKRYIYKWTSKTQNDLYEYGERKEEFVKSKEYYVMMNWGYGDDNNRKIYKLRGDWTVTDANDEKYNYKYNRKMIYNFN